MTCRLYYIVNALSTVNIHHLACDQHRTTKVLHILIAKKPVIPLRSPHLLCKTGFTPFFFLQALSNFNKLNTALLWAHSAVIFFFYILKSLLWLGGGLYTELPRPCSLCWRQACAFSSGCIQKFLCVLKVLY